MELGYIFWVRIYFGKKCHKMGTYFVEKFCLDLAAIGFCQKGRQIITVIVSSMPKFVLLFPLVIQMMKKII